MNGLAAMAFILSSKNIKQVIPKWSIIGWLASASSTQRPADARVYSQAGRSLEWRAGDERGGAGVGAGGAGGVAVGASHALARRKAAVKNMGAIGDVYDVGST